MSYGIKLGMSKEELLEISRNIESIILNRMLIEAERGIFRTDNNISIRRDALLDYVQSVIKNLSEED